MNPIFDLMVIGVIVSIVLVNLWSVREAQHAVSPWTTLKEKLHNISPWGPRPTLSSSHGDVQFSQDSTSSV